ncbi:MAG TPA: Na+/H+ antiporter NhaA [Caulobacteraceae bacterium]|nr:Na+/H+ antiporter NhaA [Caulobacteraceae bacterium]
MRRPTLDYLRTESGSGLVLATAAVAALGLANSRIAADYGALLALPVPVTVGAFSETMSLAGWVRALLMPVVFFVLGMELKFELLRGELSNPRRLGLPALAALGGLIAPIGVFLAVAHAAPSRWAVGAATDGAAALAVLAITGPRLAHSLRVLLISVAIADNLAGVVLNAVMGAGPVRWPEVAGAGAGLVALLVLSRWRRAPLLFYPAGFLMVWGFVLKSGLDPALAGVACAITVPVGARRPGEPSLLKYFMDSLHPYVAFAILPLFILTAAGVSSRAFRLSDLGAPAPLGVMLALVVGKPLGVFGLCAAGISLKLVRKPTGAKWIEILAVALICGVGFTVSYFLAGMGPPDPLPKSVAALRAAIFIGSVVAGLAGGALLVWTADARRADLAALEETLR